MAGPTKVAGPPPGLAFLLVPAYAVWRTVAGTVDTPSGFVAFHVFATLAIAATVSALIAGEVAALAGWLGASPAGQRWAALLFAFGTPAFLFATRLFKENLAALAVIAAFRLAVTAERPARRRRPGCSRASPPSWPIRRGSSALGLIAITYDRGRPPLPRRLRARRASPLAALALYNTWFFGRPWRFAYSTYINMPEVVGTCRIPPARRLACC